MDHVNDFIRRCTNEDLSSGGRRTTDLQEQAVNALQCLYTDIVEKRTRVEGQELYTFALDMLEVTEESTLDTVRSAYMDIQARLGHFEKWLHHTAVGLLPPLHLMDSDKEVMNRTHIKTMKHLGKCRMQVHSAYKLVSGHKEMMMMDDPGYEPPVSTLLSRTPAIEPSKEKEVEQSDQHKLIMWALHGLAEQKAKRYDGWVMIPRTTSTGYNSTAYERLISVDDYLPDIVMAQREQDPEIARIYLSGPKIGDWATRVLRELRHVEFPELKRSRTTFAFRDGVYYAHLNRFRPYVSTDRRHAITRPDATAMTKELQAKVQAIYKQSETLYQLLQWDFRTDTDSPSASSRTPTVMEQLRRQRRNMDAGETLLEEAACVYHDMDFNLQNVPNAMDIQTEYCDRIWNSQKLNTEELGAGPDVIKWIYALIGRMLYKVGDLDDWQVSPFFKGVAGTGKSTILKLIRKLYAPEDVGVIPNNIEPTFGLSAVYKKLINMCFELRSDFSLDQAVLQTMMSGEPMSIQVKYKTAIPNIQWEAPFAAAGNMTANWADSNGAMSRRWVIIEFSQPVTNGDPRLMEKLTSELPLFLQKCNRAYHEVLRDYGSRSPWDTDPLTEDPLVLPKYFHDQAAKLRKQLNSIMSFVMESGTLVRTGELASEGFKDDDYYMTWEEFTTEYARYCKTTSSRKLNMASPDSYETTFLQLNLKRVQGRKIDHATEQAKYTVWIEGCRTSASCFKDKDDRAHAPMHVGALAV